ncbi:MAG: enoyl-CoA hydratase/isomerase family protein [Acidimicrobiales bacterium]|nr:enoyl-CoA hydratase/isomerase family protein [Acidimicrobiales bacterium]
MAEPVSRPSDTDNIRTTVEGRVATVVVSSPGRKNAVTPPMWGQLASVFRWLEFADDIWAVVVTGDGEDFCSGADLAQSDDVHWLASMRFVNEAAIALHSLPQPTIARVDGVAVGAGLSLALGCDLIVATERARFSEIFATRGLSLDFGSSWLLPRRVGLGKAKELSLLAPIIDAAEAERIGLVDKVVPVEALDAAVAEWTDRLVSLPPIAVSQSKALLDRSSTSSLADALAAEAAAQTVNFGTRDTMEAISAFIAKREPNFRGR